MPLGTDVRVTITNTLDTTLIVHGLGSRRDGPVQPITVPPGGHRKTRFTADAQGTFFYWGAISDMPFDRRVYEDSQLSGALIVDPPDGAADDRVMVMGIWVEGRKDDGTPDFARELLVINGRPWPHTERLTYDMGDSVRWRIINASFAVHPMHLHGFFYRVDARGDVARDTLYWPHERRMVVTERMAPGTTMSMVWSPDRPGGWIFHCHNSFHVVGNPSLGGERLTAEERFGPMFTDGHPHHDPHKHVLEGMGGLVMGIYVRPPPGWEPNEPKRREYRVLVQTDTAAGRSGRWFSYVLQEGPEEPAPDSMLLPGSPIITWVGRASPPPCG